MILILTYSAMIKWIIALNRHVLFFNVSTFQRNGCTPKITVYNVLQCDIYHRKISSAVRVKLFAAA